MHSLKAPSKTPFHERERREESKSEVGGMCVDGDRRGGKRWFLFSAIYCTLLCIMVTFFAQIFEGKIKVHIIHGH